MPEESAWAEFFDPDRILTKLGLSYACREAVEFGCGYGTFTIPAARIVSGAVYALDIDPVMTEATCAKAEAAGLTNVRAVTRDFVETGTGFSDGQVDYAMLFNILHADEPVALLREARRVLAPGGCVGVIHWNHDPTTPRGPSMAIRPRPTDCISWAEEAGFHILPPEIVDFPPFHYGFVARK